MMVEWQPLAGALAATLQEVGVLDDPVWRQAFEETPRHLFVPRFLEQRGGVERVVDGTDAALRDHWLVRVYSDTNLITQARAAGPAGKGRRPTSSSSMPSIMSWMLQALDLAEGQQVLEIRTGTGYNAALLSHRLGDTNVASVDIDPALVDQARMRLGELGYAPLLAAGDGVAGLPAAAPYDAILATAAVDHIPPAWIEQLRPGGVIVTDLRGGFSGAMVLLRKIDDDTVEGRCEDYDAAFMPLRRQLGHPLRQGAASPLVMDRRKPSLMADMLELLSVADGHRVLEIGTGTGYNAALLCHRLGEVNVTSIDLDPCLVADARERLASIGYQPHLVAGDGAHGVSEHAPYHSIIATCAVPAIPAAWITQVADGGTILTDVRGEVSGALILLRKTSPDTVPGRVLARPGSFMWLRARVDNPLRNGGHYTTVFNLDDAESRTTAVDPQLVDNRDFRFVLQRYVPSLQSITWTRSDDSAVVALRADDASWAEVVATDAGAERYPITQGGPRRIWDDVERAASA